MRLSLRVSIRRFLAWAAVRFRPATVALYQRYLYQFAEHCRRTPFPKISRWNVESFSVKKHPLECVRRFYRWLSDMGQLPGADPCKGVAVPKSGRRARVLDKGERVTLRRLARRALRELLLGLEETAARPHEARGLQWEFLKSADGKRVTAEALRAGEAYFDLPRYKAQHRRANPYVQRPLAVSPRLGRLLARRIEAQGHQAGHVFTSASGRPWTAGALRCAFRRLRKKAEARRGVTAAGCVPYLYRHTKATELALAGVNGRLLADFLGHSTMELLAWYVHPSINDLCALARRRPGKDGK